MTLWRDHAEPTSLPSFFPCSTLLPLLPLKYYWKHPLRKSLAQESPLEAVENRASDSYNQKSVGVPFWESICLFAFSLSFLPPKHFLAVSCKAVGSFPFLWCDSKTKRSELASFSCDSGRVALYFWVFFSFLLNLLGWHWFRKLYRFQEHSFITHHLYTVLCSPPQVKSLPITAYAFLVKKTERGACSGHGLSPFFLPWTWSLWCLQLELLSCG